MCDIENCPNSGIWRHPDLSHMEICTSHYEEQTNHGKIDPVPRITEEMEEIKNLKEKIKRVTERLDQLEQTIQCL